MEKIRICLYSENLSPGALIHHVRNIIKYIDYNQFDIYLATTEKGPDTYLGELKSMVPNNKFFVHDRSGKYYDWDKDTGDYYPAPDTHPLYTFLIENKIDIIHDQRGGGTQFPLNSPQIKAKKIDSNVFAGCGFIKDNLAVSLCISKGVYNDIVEQLKRKNWLTHLPKLRVLYPAIDYPATNENMRKDLGIGEDIFVIGRMSNSYAGDYKNFYAYKQIESKKTLFLTPFLDDHQKENIKSLGIKNIIILPKIIDYVTKSKAYNTFDLAAHDRGESFGAFVAEAMMHSKPIVSSGWSNGVFTASNAQEELIGDPTFCATGKTQEDVQNDYTRIMLRLHNEGREYCKKIGKDFFKRAESLVAAPMIVKQIEKIYKEVKG